MPNSLMAISANAVESLMTAVRSLTGRTASAEWPLGIMEELNYLPHTADNFTKAVAGSWYTWDAPYITAISGGSNALVLKSTRAFKANTYKLSTVNLPNCSSIISGYFDNATGIQQITLGVDILESGVFNFARHLTSVSLPNLTKIKGTPFGQTSALTYLSLPSTFSKLAGPGPILTDPYQLSQLSLATYGILNVPSTTSGIVYRAANLRSVFIPFASSIYIDATCSGFFSCCGKLEDIQTKADIPYLPSYAFYNCYKLNDNSVKNVTRTTRKIGDYAFLKCSALTRFEAPNVSDIGSYAFSGCDSLSYISIPKIISLTSTLFYSCSAIKEVHVGSDITTIESNALVSASAMSIFDMRFASSHVTLGDRGLPNSYELTDTLKIYVPDADVSYYKSTGTANWSWYKNYIYGSSQYTI